MSTEQRRHMSVYERTLEKFARTPFGDWYVKNLAPRLDPPMLRLTGRSSQFGVSGARS